MQLRAEMGKAMELLRKGTGANMIKHTANKKATLYNFTIKESTFEIVYVAPRTNKPFIGMLYVLAWFSRSCPCYSRFVRNQGNPQRCQRSIVQGVYACQLLYMPLSHTTGRFHTFHRIFDSRRTAARSPGVRLYSLSSMAPSSDSSSFASSVSMD